MNICVTDILCCTPKSNTTLQINYTPIKFLTPTPQNNKVKWKNKTLKTNQTAEKPYAWRASVVNSTQTFFKKNLNTPQFILLGQYYPNIKIRQKYEKRKTQINIPQGNWCKNFKQNVSKLNPTIHKKGNTSEASEVYSGIHGSFDIWKISVITIYQSKKQKPHSKAASDKIQHLLG